MSGKKRIFQTEGRNQVLEPRPEIQIGEFTIHQPQNGELWIEHESGEAGGFSEEEFEESILKFFRERL